MGKLRVPVAEGSAYHRRYRLDGRHALFASTVRLSRNGQAQIQIVGNVEDDGTSVAQLHHDAGDVGHLDGWYSFAPARPVAGRRLVSRQVRCGRRHDDPARIICALGK